MFNRIGKTSHTLNLWRRVKADSAPWLLWVGAVLVYTPCIWWGLPKAIHPDGVHGWDGDNVAGLQTLSELHNLFVTPKPDWYVAYPLFHYLVLGFCYAPYLIYVYLTGGMSNLSSEYPYGLADPVAFFIILNVIARLVTLLMATGVVVSVYLTAKTIWNKRTGIFAAALIMLATPMFYYARTGNLDVPALFWMSLGILMAAKSLESGFTMSRAVLLGAFAAISVATKDQSAGPWLVGLVTLILFYYRPGSVSGETAHTRRWKFPVVLVLSGGIVYAFASGLVINPDRFFAHLLFLKNFRQTFPHVAQLNILRPNTMSGNGTLMLDVLEMLLLAVGPIIIILGVVGLFMTWRSESFTKLLLAMALGYLFLVIWPIHHMTYRYIFLPVLIIAFLAGRAIERGMAARPLMKTLTVGAAVVGFAWLGARGMDLTYQMFFDARIAAGEWFIKQGRPDDQLAFFGSFDTVPYLPKGMKSRQLPNDVSAVERLERERIKYVLVAPDHSSDVGMDRSKFFPDEVYMGLNDGSLGYHRVAAFETPPLFQNRLLSFPVMSPGYFVNPPVQVFRLREDESSQSR